MAIKNTLVTERLILRHFREGDAEAMFLNWASDPEVTKYVTWNTHPNVEVTKSIVNIWVSEYENPYTVRFAITIKATGELIGSIDVVHIVDGVPEIGYCSSRKHWNKGYMTEACTAMIDYLFELGYKELFIEAMVDNIGSNRVIQKCGFVFTGIKELDVTDTGKGIVKVNCYKKTR